jgi:probable phosphoglycerate mutase
MVRRLLILVRHGAIDEADVRLWGRSSVALNAEGRRQGAALAAALAPLAPARIVSSPQRRTCETAALCARSAQTLAVIDPRLDEMDFGAWTGQRFSDLHDDPDWRAWNDRRGGARTPSGETMRAAARRAIASLDEHLGIATPGPIIAVSHAEVIRAVVLLSLRIPFDEWWRLRIDPASICLLDGEARPFAVRAVNLRAVDLAAHRAPHSRVTSR